MPWVKPDTDQYEFRTLAWRNAEVEKIDQQIEELLADGWELDGPSNIKAGMLVDLYWQSLRRPKIIS